MAHQHDVSQPRGAPAGNRDNLAGRELPLPPGWRPEETAEAVHLDTEPHPMTDKGRIRVLSRRVRLNRNRPQPRTITIQTAAWEYCPPFSRMPGGYPLMYPGSWAE